MKYFYGPVPSRRLGFSLGVDITPKRACTFDCRYCQLGHKARKTTRRFFYIDLKEFNEELRSILKKKPKIDYITFSGSGEPTLHKDLDKIILNVKRITKNKYPVCVITNSSLLYRKKVRQELQSADLVVPSLDAVTPKIFNKMNQPYKTIDIDKVVNGLKMFSKEFHGQIWLEIMLIKGINDTCTEARKLKKVIDEIKPQKVQLNIPIRPSETKCPIPNLGKIKKIKEIINSNNNTETINTAIYSHPQRVKDSNIEKRILRFLQIRPATLDDLTLSIGINRSELLKYLTTLKQDDKIKEKRQKDKLFFIFNKRP